MPHYLGGKLGWSSSSDRRPLSSSTFSQYMYTYICIYVYSFFHSLFLSFTDMFFCFSSSTHYTPPSLFFFFICTEKRRYEKRLKGKKIYKIKIIKLNRMNEVNKSINKGMRSSPCILYIFMYIYVYIFLYCFTFLFFT